MNEPFVQAKKLKYRSKSIEQINFKPVSNVKVVYTRSKREKKKRRRSRRKV